MAHLVRPWIVSYSDSTGRRVPKGAAGAKRNRERATKWYGQGIPGQPPKKRIPLATDKRVAQRLLDDMVQRAERRGAKLPDLVEVNRPALAHLADFEAHLRSKPDQPTDRQVRQKVARVRRVLEGCGITFLSEIDPDKIARFLADMKDRRRLVAELPAGKEWFTLAELASLLGLGLDSVQPLMRRHRLKGVGNGRARRFPRETAEALRERLARGSSVQTLNHYLSETKSFCRWLVEAERLDRNPLAKLKRGNVALDRRHDRRELSEAELLRILNAARTSDRTIRGLTGPDRYALYLTACASGFRAEELASLTPRSFDLDADPPTVSLPAAMNKNRKASVQPVRRGVVEELQRYLADRPTGRAVWPGHWYKRAAEMLREDLAGAGVPYIVEGLDGPLFADFHAMRHTFISMLGKAGVTIKEAQLLARHSDPKLTIGRYSHASLAELGQAVDRMPDLGGPATLAFPDREKARDAMAAVGFILWQALLTSPPAAMPGRAAR